MIDAVSERRPNRGFGTGGAVGAPAIGDGGVVAGDRASGRVGAENFVVVIVVVNIESDLVEILFEIGNGSPHHSNPKRVPRKFQGMNIYRCEHQIFIYFICFNFGGNGGTESVKVGTAMCNSW